MASLVEIGPMFLEKIQNLLNVFSHFPNFLPLENNGPFIWINLNPLHPMLLCAKFGRYWPCGSGEEDVLKFVNVFSQFRNYLPLEKGRTFIWTNLSPLHPKMIYAKFGWNWPSGYGEGDENVKSLW